MSSSGLSLQDTVTVRTRLLNPTVRSFVIAELQKIRRSGGRTGIKRLTSTYVDEARGSFRVRITATVDGHDLIAKIVKRYLDEWAGKPGFPDRVDVIH